MLNEQAVMEYARQATDNAIDIMRYLQLLILPDVELQSLQQEYYSLPEDTDEEIDYKETHLGSRVIYDDRIYKVVFNLNNITLDKKEQLALPAYYSMLNSGGLYSSTSSTNTTTNDSDLIFKSGSTIAINNYSIEEVSNLDIRNIQNINFKRNISTNESEQTDIYSLNFSPLGSFNSESNNKVILKDMFTNTTDYFNSYFRDYFYSYFAEDYQMEMAFEQIIPNFTKGALFNRQYYAYASGGHFYLSAFHQSKILGYGSKMFMSGDNFIFKHGAEGSINNEKMGKYFSLQYSTGVEGVNNSNPFANIHLAGYYNEIVAGEICRDINGTTRTANQIDRDLVFIGDYKKEIDAQVENKLYFGSLINWQVVDGVRAEPAYISYDDDSSSFDLKTPSNDFNLGYGTSFDGITNLNIKYNDGVNESVELTAISKDGTNIPIVIKNVNSGSYGYTSVISDMQNELTVLNKRVNELEGVILPYYPNLFITDIQGSAINRSEEPIDGNYKFLPRDVNITSDPWFRGKDLVYNMKISDDDISEIDYSFDFTLYITAYVAQGKDVIVNYIDKSGDTQEIFKTTQADLEANLITTKFQYREDTDTIYTV